MSPSSSYQTTSTLGLIGLGTMGANLARNAARNGATVAVYNRTTEKTNAFMQQYGTEGRFVPCPTLGALVAALPAPRSIVLMVNAGAPVDAVIGELLPMLSAGDAIIDAGNSLFSDTERRMTSLASSSIHFLGMGVSGGEEGALHGPSMMPGGSREAFDRLAPLFQRMAAKDGSGGRCVAYVGAGGAGHFVKMVHNGIEYGDMQLIAETYHLLKVSGRTNAEIAAIFDAWNRSRALKSFLIEITADIFRMRDAETGTELIDLIRDAAKQKGTGKWTTDAALDLGVPVPTITAAVDARLQSSSKDLRMAAAAAVGPLQLRSLTLPVGALRDALLLSKICSYAQGFALIAEANRVHGWGIDLPEVCRLWKGGCIIRSTLLRTFEEALRSAPPGTNLLFTPAILSLLRAKQHRWRAVVAKAALAGVPLPAHGASLSYFDSVRSAWLPQNLTQAQRDFFGAHTYERLDRPGTFHTQWGSASLPAS